MEQPLKALQQAQKQNRNQAQQAFTSLWNLLNQKINNEQELRDSLLDLIPALANQYGDQAATIAIDWYNQAREQAVGVDGFYASMEGVPNFPEKAIQDTIRWQAGLLWGNNQDKDAFARFMVGAVDRWVHVRGANAMAINAERDPKSGKWAVAPVGLTCSWCTMLASRDFVYKTQDTAKAPLHAHCDCEVIPRWGEKYDQAVLRGYDPRVYVNMYEQAKALCDEAEKQLLHRPGAHKLPDEEQRVVDFARNRLVDWFAKKTVAESAEFEHWSVRGKSEQERLEHARQLSRAQAQARKDFNARLKNRGSLSQEERWRLISALMRVQNPQNLTDGKRIEDAMVGDLRMSDWMTFRDHLARRYVTMTDRSAKMPPLVPDSFEKMLLAGKYALTAKAYNHIAYGEYDSQEKYFKGGHLHGYGWVQEKDEFPENWTMDDIITAAEYVMNHPLSIGNYSIDGVYKGFHLYVAYDKRTKMIRTISPRNGGR